MNFIDRKFRKPRIWSNQELRKFAPLFRGDILNVSGWKDEDKEGKHYKDYFQRAEHYSISNFKSEARGLQGNQANEFFLNLEQDLPHNLIGKYDVAFNHTTLEHVFDFFKAFQNICLLSKDLVVLIVPFLQEQHGDYGDYWRFSPTAIEKLFSKNGFKLIYLNSNDSEKESIYIFAIATKNPDHWLNIFNHPDNKVQNIENYWIGKNSIRNHFLFRIQQFLQRNIL